MDKRKIGGDIMDQNEKWLHTMEIYDEYEKRFARARLNKPFYVPTTEEDQRNIVDAVKQMLCYDERLLPTIVDMKEVSREHRDGYDVMQLHYTTWENFHSAGTLFMPHGDQKVPMVFVFCGHGAEGRLTEGFVLMGERLAKMGVAVMVPDNIGQGDRSAYGHRDTIAPFYCGITLQGMILMESVALIRHMINHPRVDKSRVGACGNSGGGTLCLFLAALAPELSVLCPTGYTSEFSYILSKERRHCTCNLLPGCANGPEMWEILSAFAPKPLLIEQGKNDCLIPDDLFLRNARKVGHVYRQMGVASNFRVERANTLHPWVEEDRQLISQFLVEHLGVEFCDAEDTSVLASVDSWHVALPEDGLTTDALAERLTGKKMPEGTKLFDVYPPTFRGRPITEDEIIPDIGRGEVMRVLAQMECALKK